jgi:diguanylate cyclase (GGDEF)-like protein/putative nucleotidyltransferase with HDIG domain
MMSYVGGEAAVARGDTTPVDGLVAAAREVLGMELAYLAEVRDTELVLREVDGDSRAYGGVQPGSSLPREYSWCHAMVAGEAPQLVVDADQLPLAAGHPFVTATGIRAYAGVPVRRADGSVYGSLCCLSRLPQPQLDQRDLRYLDVLARMVGSRLEEAEGAQLRRRAEVEAAAGQALLAALNARENYTAAHSEAVLELALEVAAELGIDGEESTSVGQVALLHDIGKVGVPDAILRKPGRLTEPEWQVMREHPSIGAQIVGAIGSLSHLAPAVRAEHERWDGAGYPDGLAGESVPLPSRICFVCDAWHAMTSDRPYRRALTAAEARAEIERHGGTQFCPTTVGALMRVLDREGAPVERPPKGVPAASPLPQLRPDRPLEAELRALITVSSAVAGAHRFEEVLDAVGEQACKVLRASGISISRWEPEHDRMRTLSNAGELNPGDEERPEEELWALTALDRVLVERGEPYVIALDHVGLPAEERDFLRRIGRGSALAAPIRFGDGVWGVLEAYSRVGSPPFTASHVSFAEALCAQVATAIGRAELFSRLESLAYEDPLTRLPNRRALDERLEGSVAQALATRRELALLFCDLDGLKDVNDRHGHDAGDRALQAAANALAHAAEAFPGSFTSRLGGDEFCVLMEGHGAESARALARDAAQQLASAPGGPFTFSCGVACVDDEHRRSADLFRAADAAQYAAKRVGGDKLFVAEPGIPTPAIPVQEPWSRRRFRDAGPHEREALVRFLLELLDGELHGAGELARLEAVTGAFAEAFDAARWAISRRRPGAPEVETLLGSERRDRYDPAAPDIRFSVEGEAYALADYPLTAHVLERGGGFAIHAADERADPRERALLTQWGFTAVTAVAALAPDGAAWLVELFSDARTHALPSALPELRLLVGEAARRGPAPGYGAAVTSRAKSSKTST